METLPVTVEELIAKLDEEFPERMLGTGDFNRSDRELWFEAGARSVVRLLIDLRDEAFADDDEAED